MLSVWSLALLAVVTVLLLLHWVYKKVWLSFQVFEKMGVKGPKPEVFFGNSRQRRKMGWKKFLSWVTKEFGPISGFYQGTYPYLLVSDLDTLEHIFKENFKCFTDKPWFPSVLLPKASYPLGLTESGGEEWKTSRQTLSPFFSTDKLKKMIALVESSAQRLISNIDNIVHSGKSENFYKVFGSYTMEVIVSTAFGRELDIQEGEKDEFIDTFNFLFSGAKEDRATLQYIYPIASHVPFVEPIAWFVFHYLRPEGVQIEKMAKIAHALIEKRRQAGNPREYKDLLQLMIEANVQEGNGDCPIQGNNGECPMAKRKKKLSNEQILVQSLTFLLAGYETTANTLTYTAYLLALHPEVQERLQREIDTYMKDNLEANLFEATEKIKYLDMVLQESLRMYTPIQYLLRRCVKTTTVNGLTIPEGVCIMVPLAVIHKDPQYWEEPEKFSPERFTPEERSRRPKPYHMPFGYGRRNCIGMRLALLEAKVALITILRKYSFVRCPDTEVPLQTVVGIAMAPKNGVYLKVVPRGK